MRRSRLHELLHSDAAGDLDAAGRAEVERLLADDASAREALGEIQAAHAALRTLRDRPEPPLPAAEAAARVRAAIAGQAFEPRPKLYLESEGTRFYRRLALAATVLMAVTLGMFAYRSLQPRGEEGGPGAAPVATPEAGLTSADVSAEERGLKRFVELGGRREGIPAAEFLRIREEEKLDLRQLVVTPMDNAMPISNPGR